MQLTTGEVSVNIVTSDANNLDDEDYYGMMHFARLLCGATPAMDKNSNFKKRIFSEKEINYIINNCSRDLYFLCAFIKTIDKTSLSMKKRSCFHFSISSYE